MAMISCPECNQSVSDQAVACPHCGYPILTRTTATMQPGVPGQGYPPVPPPGYPAFPQSYPPQSLPPGYAALSPRITRQNSYLRGIAITALIGSILLILIGFVKLVSLSSLLTTGSYAGAFYFSNTDFFYQGTIQVLEVLTLLLGGGLTLYHSIRSLSERPSASFRLSFAWIWPLLYLLAAGLLVLQSSNPPPSDFTQMPWPLLLYTLETLTCALFFVWLFGRFIASANRNTTTWRRMLTAFVCGAAIATNIDLLFELVQQSLLLSSGYYTHCSGTIPFAICNYSETASSSTYLGLAISPTYLSLAISLAILAVIFRPAILTFLVPKIRSRAEMLLIGLASGAGYALVMGYITPALNFYYPSDWGKALWTGVGCISTAALACATSVLASMGWYCWMRRSEPHHAMQGFFYWLAAAVLACMPFWLILPLKKVVAENQQFNASTFMLVSWFLPQGIEIVLSCVALLVVALLVRRQKRMEAANSSASQPTISTVPAPGV